MRVIRQNESGRCCRNCLLGLHPRIFIIWISLSCSDISVALALPRPGVTRTVKEMEAKGYLKKTASEEDGRVLYLSITEEGKNLSEKYNERFFNALAPSMEVIPEADAECMIQTIEQLYQIMCERRIYFDK